MAVVVVAVVRNGRAFSGGATTGVVDDVGADVTGCRGPLVATPYDRTCARVRLFWHGGARLSSADGVACS
jgi:hypothetical protein